MQHVTHQIKDCELRYVLSHSKANADKTVLWNLAWL